MVGAPTGGQPGPAGGNSRPARRYNPASTWSARSRRTRPAKGASPEPVTVIPSSEMPLDRTARRFRRPLVAGLLGSVLLHAAVVLAAGRVGPVGTAAPGERADRSRRPAERVPADALRMVNVRAAETEIRVPAPPAEVRAEPVEVEAAAPREDALAGARLAPPSRGRGGAAETGGPAAGRPADTPPVPRSVLPEWDAPSSVRGHTVTVRVHVDSAGRPTGAVELEPPTPHQGFNDRLTETVRAMRFSPARTAGGRAVAAWAELTFSF